MGGDESPFAEAVSEIFSIREANIVGSISLVVILICGSINLFQWTQVEYTEAVDAATETKSTINYGIQTYEKYKQATENNKGNMDFSNIINE